MGALVVLVLGIGFTSRVRNSVDSDLEEIMSAVTRACAIPNVNVYGFFLTMTKKISGRQMVAWMARLRDKTHIIIIYITSTNIRPLEK